MCRSFYVKAWKGWIMMILGKYSKPALLVLSREESWKNLLSQQVLLCRDVVPRTGKMVWLYKRPGEALLLQKPEIPAIVLC